MLTRIISVLLILMGVTLSSAHALQLPATGQTTSYATGDDGDLERGIAWPAARFTDDGSDMVTDNLTGLVWTRDANLMATRDPDFDTNAQYGKVTWQRALDYVKKLNDENYLGHSDWRLPNRKELRSLVDYSSYDPALPPAHPFTNVQDGWCWSSSSSAYGTGYAWIVHLTEGYVDRVIKSSNDNYVWPVRAGQSGALGNSTISVTPTTKDFASVAVDSASAPQEFSIANIGAADVTLSPIAVAGADAEMFDVTAAGSNQCASLTPTIAPGQSCTVTVIFTPTSEGAKSTILRVVSNNPSATALDVALSGTGIVTPPTGSLTISSGAEYTSTAFISLTVSATDAVTMQFSTNGSTWTVWEKFKPTRSFTIPAGDGLKTVYARFKDGTGKISTIYTDTIILDTKPPLGVITINGGAYATTDTNVTLTLSAADVNGVTEMQFSTNNIWTGVPWVPFAPTMAYTIPATPGVRTVYARFRDTVGKISVVCSDTIVYTTTAPPTATASNITINGGAGFTLTTASQLTITSPDQSFTHMRFSTNGTTWTAWEAVKATRSLALPAGNGVKTVYVKFRTATGSESGIYIDTIILDTKPPVGTVSINGGAASTADPAVTLSLSAADANGVTEMQFNTINTWAGVPWVPFAQAQTFGNLTATPGVKTVYVRFKDAAGKISAAYSDAIKLVAP